MPGRVTRYISAGGGSGGGGAPTFTAPEQTRRSDRLASLLLVLRDSTQHRESTIDLIKLTGESFNRADASKVPIASVTPSESRQGADRIALNPVDPRIDQGNRSEKQVIAITLTSVGANNFTVPPSVTSIVVECDGAQGGHGGPSTLSATLPAGALGGRATCTIATTPGEVLQVNVGGQGTAGATGAGTTAGGSNGGGGGGAGNTTTGEGGGGGGASDVRQGGVALANRVCIGGGGGGGGGNNASNVGGAGGGGGNTSGVTGTAGASTVGTAAGGGVGGSQAGPGGGGGAPTGGTGGGAGVSNVGGSGSTGSASGPAGGGGGGGGLFGAGGGGGGGTTNAGGGGGGGSSSATGTSPAFVNSVNSGNGKVVLSWSV